MKPLLVLALVACSSFAFGQTPLQYVPADVPFVLSVNLGNLDKKVSLSQLREYNFYKAIIKEIDEEDMSDAEKVYQGKFMENPAELGFDMLQPFYFFMKKEADTTFYTLVMKMGDRPRYEGGLMELFPDTYWENLTEKDGYLLWQDESATYAWNDQIILNIWAEVTPTYDWGGDENYDWGTVEEEPEWEYEEVPEEEMVEEPEIIYREVPDEVINDEMLVEPPVEEEQEVVFEDEPIMEWESIDFEDEEVLEEEAFVLEENTSDTSDMMVEEDYSWLGNLYEQPDTRETAANWANQLLTGQIGNTLSKNHDFRNAAAQSDDVHFWMNYSYFMEELQNSGAAMGMGGGMEAQAMQMMQGMLGTLYDDAYLSAGLSFEKGKMAIRSQLFFNDNLEQLYRGMYDVKFNKKFLRYVEGGNDMYGYAYFNFNMENTIEEGKGLMHKMFAEMPGKEGLMASDMAKILGIFIDEEAIGNLVKGDLLVAVSGTQTVYVNDIIYEYDEDYNYTAKDTTLEKTMPIVTALASYGKRSEIKKFIELGLHSEVLTREGKFYKMVIPGEGIEIFLAMHNGIMIMTNDRSLMEGKLENGFPKNQRLSKKHRKLLCDNASVFYWDIPNTMREIEGESGESNIGPFAYVSMFGKQFESMVSTSSKKVDGSVISTVDFNFVNKNVNSLDLFFNFINDIYLEFIGGAKT